MSIEKKYEKTKKNFKKLTETYENLNSNGITLDELMCGVGHNRVGTVSNSKYVCFKYIKCLLEDFENAKLPII